MTELDPHAPLLSVRDLRVGYRTDSGVVEAVRGVDFDLSPGEILGIVGESGSGKSTVAMSLTALNRGPSTRLDGEIRYRGANVLELSERELRRIRGAEVAMIFQDPMTSLTPVHRVTGLIAEVVRAHEPVSRRAARARAVEMLREVGIGDPRRGDDFPHQFSGGMRQRVMIAMALACRPAILVADEPTTALDVTTQAQILKLIRRLRAEHGTAVVLITHDLGVVAQTADRVLVMHGGRWVEDGDVTKVLSEPKEPYTQALLAAVPRADRAPRRDGGGAAPPVSGDGVLLRLRDFHKTYRVDRRTVQAVRGVSLEVAEGETLGLVGESGSGKSTLARCVMALQAPTSGTISFAGRDLASLGKADLRAVRREMTMVFQDPFDSLNPQRRVGEVVAAPLAIHRLGGRAERRRQVLEMLERVGLDAGYADRYPHELSGGQRQRVGIARALITRPRLVLCDEPVSALDVTVQAQILDLLAGLQRELGLTLVFIAHDLGVVRQVSKRIAVMYLGEIVEEGEAETIFTVPRHPYTQRLLAAVPSLDPHARISDAELLAEDPVAIA